MTIPIIIAVLLLLLCLFLIACKRQATKQAELWNQAPAVEANFDTPEGALLMLEEAYKTKDIEVVVRCKGFEQEAKLMLTEAKLKFTPDAELLKETSDTLELAFRAEIKQTGFPDMNGIVCRATKREPYADQVVVITEVCKYPDGGTSAQKVLVAQTANGWRVLHPLDR